MIDTLNAITYSPLMLANVLLAIPDANYGMMPQDSNGNAQIKDAFLFDIDGEQSLELVSEITDHPTEDNLSIADNIAIKPDIYTISGFIGELNDILPKDKFGISEQVTRLWVLQSLAPELTIAGQQAYNLALAGYQLINTMKRYESIKWSSMDDNDEFGGIGQIGGQGLATENNTYNDVGNINKAQSKQQIALQKLYIYRQNRIGFTIQTPWAVMKNMYIQQITVRQSEDNKFMSEFSITFKMIRKARTGIESNKTSNSEVRVIQSAQKVANGELSKGANVDMSTLLGQR